MTAHQQGLAAKNSFKMAAFEVASFETDSFRIRGYFRAYQTPSPERGTFDFELSYLKDLVKLSLAHARNQNVKMAERIKTTHCVLLILPKFSSR